MSVIVWLEIDGKLKTCSVRSPWAEFFIALNGIPKDAPASVSEHFRVERKRLAAEVVANGAYELHHKEGH